MKGFLHGLARCTLVLSLIMLAVILTGCGCGGADDQTAAACAPGEVRCGNGACQPAGSPCDTTCPPGEQLDGGACQKASVPGTSCPPSALLLDGGVPGRRTAARTCVSSRRAVARCWHVPRRPACRLRIARRASCPTATTAASRSSCQSVPTGQLAVPERAHVTTWPRAGAVLGGDIPVDATTQYVKPSVRGREQRRDPGPPVDHHPGGDRLGRFRARSWPWRQAPTRGRGDPRQAGAALGTVPRDGGDRWGRRGVGIAPGRLRAGGRNGDSWPRGPRGTQAGIGMAAASSVTIEQIWVHDTGKPGLDVEGAYGPTSVALQAVRSSSMLRTPACSSSALPRPLGTSVVRSTLPDAQGNVRARHRHRGHRGPRRPGCPGLPRGPEPRCGRARPRLGRDARGHRGPRHGPQRARDERVRVAIEDDFKTKSARR